MKLDVSDLFDSLYDVAMFSRGRFDLARDAEPNAEWDAWDEYCSELSDCLFLSACASRVFKLTHMEIEREQIKSRIITKSLSEDGTELRYCRYLRPYFVDGPKYAGSPNRELQFATILSRPHHQLLVWLGKLPPEKCSLVPPAYSPETNAPMQYFSRQYIGFISRSPQVHYYEFHGDWCLRHIRMSDGVLQRDEPGGKWLKMDGLTSLPEDVFEKIWDQAIEIDGPVRLT